MKKRLILLIVLFLFCYLVKANYLEAQSCNGVNLNSTTESSISPITLNGKKLVEFLNNSNVDEL